MWWRFNSRIKKCQWEVYYRVIKKLMTRCLCLTKSWFNKWRHTKILTIWFVRIFLRVSAFFKRLSGFFWRGQKVILPGFLYTPPYWIRKKNHAINCFPIGITHHIQQMKLSDLNELKSLKARFLSAYDLLFQVFLGL